MFTCDVFVNDAALPVGVWEPVAVSILRVSGL